MTTEEMMEFYKNAWHKERENSNKLCMLKDEAIEKMLRLQELLSQEEDRIRSLLERIGEAETIL